MAKFLTSNALNSQLEELFETAQEKIILISPYIKLHDRFKASLNTHKDNPNLELVVVFGKNEDDVKKSMSVDDLNFFKAFPRIEIRYEKNLHAKYYANESFAVLTSMNLHKYSHDNNIEFGILTRPTILSLISKSVNERITGDNVDNEALNYFEKVIYQAEEIFKKVPKYDKGILRTGIKKKYTHSEILVDKVDETFKKINQDHSKPTKSQERPLPKEQQMAAMGYCIRSGKPIPFNLAQPLSLEAYSIWSVYKNVDFKEKFCHFTGEESNGETTYAKPVMYKNWSKASEVWAGK